MESRLQKIVSLKGTITKETWGNGAVSVWGDGKSSPDLTIFQEVWLDNFSFWEETVAIGGKGQTWKILGDRFLYFELLLLLLQLLLIHTTGHSTFLPGLSTQKLPYFLIHGDSWSCKECFFINVHFLTVINGLKLSTHHSSSLQAWPWEFSLGLPLSSINADVCFLYVPFLWRGRQCGRRH